MSRRNQREQQKRGPRKAQLSEDESEEIGAAPPSPSKSLTGHDTSESESEMETFSTKPHEPVKVIPVQMTRDGWDIPIEDPSARYSEFNGKLG